MEEEQITGIVDPKINEKTSIGLPFRVIVFNDDIHTFDEVIGQLIKAVGCSFEKAKDYAFTIHVKGQAIVYHGELNACLKVTSVLEEIGLHTQILSE